MVFSNKVYDILKRIITVVVPGFIALLTALAGYWQWNIPLNAIVGTISAVATFIGICLGISTKQYNEAQIEAHPEGMSDDDI